MALYQLGLKRAHQTQHNHVSIEAMRKAPLGVRIITRLSMRLIWLRDWRIWTSFLTRLVNNALFEVEKLIIRTIWNILNGYLKLINSSSRKTPNIYVLAAIKCPITFSGDFVRGKNSLFALSRSDKDWNGLRTVLVWIEILFHGTLLL